MLSLKWWFDPKSDLALQPTSIKFEPSLNPKSRTREKTIKTARCYARYYRAIKRSFSFDKSDRRVWIIAGRTLARGERARGVTDYRKGSPREFLRSSREPTRSSFTDRYTRVSYLSAGYCASVYHCITSERGDGHTYNKRCSQQRAARIVVSDPRELAALPFTKFLPFIGTDSPSTTNTTFTYSP